MTLDSEIREKLDIPTSGEVLTIPLKCLGFDYVSGIDEISKYASSRGFNVMVLQDGKEIHVHYGLRLIAGEDNA